jgi:uncharacterized protein YndB with AHSA1/START domain
MANTAAPTRTGIEIRKTIRASQQRVYDAWTKEEELKRWHAPGPLTVDRAEVDVRVGGVYRIHMLEPSGVEHRVVGTFREVDPPRRLAYSWQWETGDDQTVSNVTIDFIERGAETEVVLKHDGFSREEANESHLQGWTSIMEKLAGQFAG